MRLVRLGKNAGPVSTASRLDAFLLPDSLESSRSTTESLRRARGTRKHWRKFSERCRWRKSLRKNTRCNSYPLSAKLLDALVTSYLDWENFQASTDVDYRLAGSADLERI